MRKVLCALLALIWILAVPAALAEGDIELANSMLGRRFSISGCAVRGKGVGRKLGAPTLNFEVAPPLRLGVYVVDTPYGRGVANYGTAPTMGDCSWRAPVLEVHLLDGCNINEEESESSLKVEFVRFLRPERRFGSSAALSRQIAADVRAARWTL